MRRGVEGCRLLDQKNQRQGYMWQRPEAGCQVAMGALTCKPDMQWDRRRAALSVEGRETVGTAEDMESAAVVYRRGVAAGGAWDIAAVGAASTKAVAVAVAVAACSRRSKHSRLTEERSVGEVTSCRCSGDCWWVGAVEVEGTAALSKHWAWAEVAACTAAAAVAGAGPVLRPWPRHDADRIGRWWAALRPSSKEAIV